MHKVSTNYEQLKSNELFGYLYLDSRCKVLDVNTDYCHMLDFSPEELVGKNISELVIEAGLKKKLLHLFSSNDKNSRTINFTQATKAGNILQLQASVIVNTLEKSLILIVHNFAVSEAETISSSTHAETQKLWHSLDASNGGIWEWNSVTDRHIWQDRMYTMLGYMPGEFIVDRKKMSELIHPDDRSFLFKSGTAEILKYGDNKFSIKARFRCKSGNWKMIISRGKAVEFDSAGNPVRFIGMHIDIDEAESRFLTRNKPKYERTIVNPQWDYWVDHEGHPVHVSSSCEEFTGYSFNEFIDDPELHVKIIHPADLKTWNSHYNGLKPQSEIETRFRIVGKDGKIKWIHHICTSITSRDGNSLGYHISNKDISEYQKSYEATKKFIDVIEQCPLSILFTNLDQRIEFANRKTLEVTGYHLNELIGKRMDELIDSNIFNEISQTIRSGKVWKGNIATSKDSSRIIKAKLKLSRIMNPSGDLNSYMVIGEEIDNKGDKENEELSKAGMQEHKQSRRHTKFDNELIALKSEFVSQASHEFRTPLASISSSAQMIMRYLQKWDGKKLAEHSIRINQSVGNLNELIDEILTISEVINRKIKVVTERVDFTSWINEIIQECSSILKPGQTILQETMINTAYIEIDKTLMKRTINILLDNAIKYSNENSTIVITSRLRKKQLVISIADEGIGIDKEELQFIFDSFYRCGSVMKTKGSGLGLSIAQKTIEFLNGNISVESQLGQGSKFTISIPMN